MYVPATFAVHDLDKLHALIEQYGFATLITHPAGEPLAGHLPLLLDRRRGPHGTLLGHMARANPQWKSAPDQRALAVFTGPHAYVSPTWYAVANSVPTWNYAAVHAYGTLQPRPDREWLLQLLRRTVDVYEARLARPWSIDRADSAFIEGLLDGIVGFEIEIDRIEGKWKFNQNHDAARRRRVIHALRATGRHADCETANWMEQALDAGVTRQLP